MNLLRMLRAAGPLPTAIPLSLVLAVSAAAAVGLSGHSPAFWRWAERPPMGWNSWDGFATTVTEAQTKAQADYMTEHLKSHGWEYIVVDIQWYEPNAQSFEYRKNAELTLDGFGRLWPATNRFPSSANGVGFKALADYVHGKGLKFGIHLMRGIPRQAVRENTRVKGTEFRARDVANTNSLCEWNPDMFGVDMTKPGGQDYYDSVFELIASWGVDYVKVDDASNNRASRHLMGLAYLGGKRPSLLLMRGTYTKMLVDAYDLVDGKLVPVWKWCGDNEQPPVRGQGMHGMHAADVDGDGRDEIVLGAAVLDDNGKILCNLGMGHPDAVYVSDILPDRPGLEIIYGFETKQDRNGFCLVEAKTGKLIWGSDHPTTHIHSQGLFGDFDPANPGPEFYDGEKFGPDRWIYSARDGKLLAREDLGSLAPLGIYWAEGDLKLIAVRGRISPFRGKQLGSYEGKVVALGDVLGDWREELVTSLPGELRIYSTTIPASRRRVCLLQDRAYRTDVALEAMGYLYPPQVGLGSSSVSPNHP